MVAHVIEEDKFLLLTDCSLNVKTAMDFVSSPACGAISLFTGCTRENEERTDTAADGSVTVTAFPITGYLTSTHT